MLSDPGDSPQAVAELTGRHDLDRGVAVCQPHPGATSPELLAGDLLIALGKLPGALAAEHLAGAAGSWRDCGWPPSRCGI